MSDSLLAWLTRVSGALDEHDVPYAIAGGLGLAAWGCARATTDLDLVIASGPSAIDQAREAARSIGLLQHRRAVMRFKSIAMLRLVATPSSFDAIPVDLIMIPKVLEADLLVRARRLPLGRSTAAFATAEDIVLLKLLRGSDQDRVDIRALAERNELDRSYVKRGARALRVTSRLSRALPAWARKRPRRA
jgi:hypothetical protein